MTFADRKPPGKSAWHTVVFVLATIAGMVALLGLTVALAMAVPRALANAVTVLGSIVTFVGGLGLGALAAKRLGLAGVDGRCAFAGGQVRVRRGEAQHAFANRGLRLVQETERTLELRTEEGGAVTVPRHVDPLSVGAFVGVFLHVPRNVTLRLAVEQGRLVVRWRTLLGREGAWAPR